MFYTIDYAIYELEEHAGELCRNISPLLFYSLLNKLVKPKLNIINFSKIKDYESRAKGIAQLFDPDDWPFIALAMKINKPIWTNDTDLIKYSLITCKYLALDTTVLLKILRGEIKLSDEYRIKKELRERYNIPT